VRAGDRGAAGIGEHLGKAVGAAVIVVLIAAEDKRGHGDRGERGGIGIVHRAEQQARGVWDRHPVRPVSQCRVGLLGLGAVGQAIARAFAVDLHTPDYAQLCASLALPHARCSDLAQLPALLAQTDILVCALPLTADTRGLLNRERLSQLPRGAIVVNVGRGEQVVEPDLKALLDEGHLAGAVMDVFDREPPRPDDWTWQHPQVLATPHIAAQASFTTVATQCVDTLRRLRDGQPPQWLVDRSAGY